MRTRSRVQADSNILSSKDMNITSTKRKSKKTKSLMDNMDAFRINHMSCLPNSMPSIWSRKKRNMKRHMQQDTAVDPLTAIIEEAKNATSDVPRCKLVQFNLGKNEAFEADHSGERESLESLLKYSRTRNLKPKSILRTIPIASNDEDNITKFVHQIVFNNGDLPQNSYNEEVQDIEVTLQDMNISICEPNSLVLSAAHKLNSSSSTLSTSSSSTTDDHDFVDKQHDFQQDPKILMKIRQSFEKGDVLFDKFNFPKAAKHYLHALNVLNENAYPHDHPLRKSVSKAIHDNHHAHKNVEHSAKIVKIGLAAEARGEYVKAMKMYTIAFRIRKELLGKEHPSLPVLLNLLGAIQMKKNDYINAMQTFTLALCGNDLMYMDLGSKDNIKCIIRQRRAKRISASTLSLSLREIGSIYEKNKNLEKTMLMYKESLDCILEKDASSKSSKSEGYKSRISKAKSEGLPSSSERSGENAPSLEESLDVCIVDSCGEMEVYLPERVRTPGEIDGNCLNHLAFYYDSFFQTENFNCRKLNLHAATTLHNMANVHIKRKEYKLALSSYQASLRGMKIVHGDKHQHVAAVLGNIANLLKDMKEYDKAYDIYMRVLKIESLRLGYSHPAVMISMLNVAMIEKCRDRVEESITLYKEVIQIINKKKSREGTDGLLSVSYTFLGDALEKKGDFLSAIDAYRQALKIRSSQPNGQYNEIARYLHQLGELYAKSGQYHNADDYFSRSLKMYKKVKKDDQDFIQRIHRQTADNRLHISSYSTL
ncbi:hypothetical protein CTEN210_05596 [Chaetoceros tenuissimus]|uniref:Kinesin light chain n=1 Tax=Chaetoceros tenuissimus TaxID=426638 RepID=A0AAD3CQ61_9STRA|nr:hypothetical protein CTEN210_05596 [Chaetoceros tenuissimus]